MPPSALTSSTAIAARFAVAAANTLPGPDLLVSRPRRWSRRSVGSRTRYPRRRMSQRRPSSSRSATTRTRVPLPSASKRSRSVPRQGTSRWMSIRPGRPDETRDPPQQLDGGPPSGARSATAAPGASRSHTVSNSQPAPAPAPTRSNTALGGASIRCSTERARPAIRWLGRPERPASAAALASAREPWNSSCRKRMTSCAGPVRVDGVVAEPTRAALGDQARRAQDPQVAGHGRAADPLDGVGQLARAALVALGEHREDLAADRVRQRVEREIGIHPVPPPRCRRVSGRRHVQPRIARCSAVAGELSARPSARCEHPQVDEERRIRDTGAAAAHPGHDVRHGRPVEHAEQPGRAGARAAPVGRRPDHDHVGVLAGVEAVRDAHAACLADACRQLGELCVVVDVGVLARRAAAAAAADGDDGAA